MTRRPLLAIGTALAALVIAQGAAFAATAPVTIDSRSAELTETDGGDWNVALGFTNNTTGRVRLSASLAGDSDCAVEVPGLRAAQHSDVTVTIPADCDVAEEKATLRLLATQSGSEPQPFRVVAKPAAEAGDPDWDHLGIFPILFAAALIVLGAAALWATRGAFFDELPYLEATWDFKESWASNVTVAGGLLTALLGSTDVLEPIFGDEAETATALATVGAAVAVAMAGAGALAALACRRRADDGITELFTPYGLAFAGALTMAAAGGELWIVLTATGELDFGWFDDKLVGVGVVLGALITIYAVRSLMATLRAGRTPPAEPAPSETIIGALLLLEGIRNVEGVDVGVIDTFAERYPALVPKRTRLTTTRGGARRRFAPEGAPPADQPVPVVPVTAPARRAALL